MIAVEVALHVPAKPVKSTFFTACPEFRNNKAYVPSVKLKDMDCDSDNKPGVTVDAVEPVRLIFTTGVPVMVNPTTLAVDQSVPPAEPARIKLPVPKAMVLVLELLELKTPGLVMVAVCPFRSSVPVVKVTPEKNAASCNAHDPVALLKVVVPPRLLPLDVIVAADVDRKVTELLPKNRAAVPTPKNMLP
jgi:hypothetical protein